MSEISNIVFITHPTTKCLKYQILFLLLIQQLNVWNIKYRFYYSFNNSMSEISNIVFITHPTTQCLKYQISFVLLIQQLNVWNIKCCFYYTINNYFFFYLPENGSHLLIDLLFKVKWAVIFITRRNIQSNLP